MVQGTDAATSKPGHVGQTCTHLLPGAQGLLCLPTWPTRSVGSVNRADGAGESPAAEAFPWEAHCGQCPWLSLAYFPLQSSKGEPRLLEVCSVNGAVAVTVSALLLSVRLLMVQTGMRHGSCRHTSILSVCRGCGCVWGGGQLRTSVPGVEGRLRRACGSPLLMPPHVLHIWSSPPGEATQPLGPGSFHTHQTTEMCLLSSRLCQSSREDRLPKDKREHGIPAEFRGVFTETVAFCPEPGW